LVLSAGVTPALSADLVREPLDVPAQPSALVAKRALLAVTLAGTRLVAAGRMGHIVYSDDLGLKWIQARVPVSVDLVAVSFVNPRNGWATGHDGAVLHSADGGASWTLAMDGRRAARLMVDYYTARQASGDPAVAAALAESKRFLGEQGARPFLDVWFENEQSGYVVGAWGLMLKTDDGGHSWVPWLDRVDNPRSNHLNAIRRIDGRLWIVGEQGLLLRFDENLQRFLAVKSPTDGSLFGILGQGGNLMAFGLSGRAFISQNDGLNWSKAGGTGTAGLSAGTILADGRFLLVDTNAGMWLSGNKGKSFSQVRLAQPMPVFDVVAVAPRTIVVVGLLGAERLAIAPMSSSLHAGPR
jgi:photosystem II stability/assembly factor-like uncharacterized protein